MKKQMITAKIAVAALVLTSGGMARAQWTTNFIVGALNSTFVGSTALGGSTTWLTNADGSFHEYSNWQDGRNWDTGATAPAINFGIPNGVAQVHSGYVYLQPGPNPTGYAPAGGGTTATLANKWYIGYVDSTFNEFLLTGGELQICSNRTSIRIGDQSTAAFFQTGGTFYLPGASIVSIGDWNALSPSFNPAKANGLYTIGGGLVSNRGGVAVGGRIQLNRNLTLSPYPSANFWIGGDATVDFGPTINTIQASGVLTTAPLQFGPAGTNVLSVTGPNATINLDSLVMQTNAPTSGPKTGNRIQFTFDQNGPSLIHVNGNYTPAQVQAIGGANCILRAGYLSVNYTYGSLTNSTTFNLMTADRILDDPNQPFVMDPNIVDSWSMAVVGTGVMGDGLLDTLQVTYIGPSTFVGSPPLTISKAGNNQVIVSWSPLATAAGWWLQTTTDLDTVPWDWYSGPYVDSSAIISPATGNLFFRMSQ